MPYERSCFILGITSSGILSGLLIGVSASTIPSLLAAPAGTERTVLRQFDHLWSIGARGGPSVAVVASIFHFVNAYNLYHPDIPLRTYKFIAAGISIFSMIPWTLVAIAPVNTAIYNKIDDMRRASKGNATQGFGLDDDVPSGEGSEVRDLLHRWIALNWVRAGLVLTGTFLAFDAL